MKKKRIAVALGHEALGITLPEQKQATAAAQAVRSIRTTWRQARLPTA